MFKGRNVPVFFVRFEQLLAEPQKTLEEVFRFLLDSKDVENTVVQRRIKDVVAMAPEDIQIYPVDKKQPEPSMAVFTEK